MAKMKSQRSLEKWTSEKWRTSDGKKADRKGGTVRYLPDKAWKSLSASEKKATNDKKRAGSRKGKQFVGNTPAAKKASKRARS